VYISTWESKYFGPKIYSGEIFVKYELNSWARATITYKGSGKNSFTSSPDFSFWFPLVKTWWYPFHISSKVQFVHIVHNMHKMYECNYLINAFGIYDHGQLRFVESID
jgi:hypothetical protein